ncbi:MAG: transcriptional regulator [Chloroflexi bacterium CFX4]|nr:transcriptional regulator [Chloroflexi bacterium CFX4]MDL1921340.1 helix-turn-helix transcriptional regulator [Chloroflexi bacterium CFX3]
MKCSMIADQTTCSGHHTEAESLQNAPISPQIALAVADFFKALADPTRVRIISLLVDAEICVGDLCRLLGMSQPSISQQLRTLRAANLVTMRREGKHIFYTLSDDHVRTVFRQCLDHIQE